MLSKLISGFEVGFSRTYFCLSQSFILDFRWCHSYLRLLDDKRTSSEKRSNCRSSNELQFFRSPNIKAVRSSKSFDIWPPFVKKKPKFPVIFDSQKPKPKINLFWKKSEKKSKNTVNLQNFWVLFGFIFNRYHRFLKFLRIIFNGYCRFLIFLVIFKIVETFHIYAEVVTFEAV